MANIYEYDRRRHHQLLHHKAIFLPMFCRLSLKDINPCRRRRDSAVSDEPSSPKVSCMGQVKRNNRITGLPSAAPTATHRHKYAKLKKLFSSKALLPSSTAACIGGNRGGGRIGSKSCRSSEEMCIDNLKRLKLKKDCDRDCAKVIDIGDLDPPLPVLKKAAPPQGVGGDEVNLWKRRFNGAALKTLQIESINLPNSKVSLPPTLIFCCGSSSPVVLQIAIQPPGAP